MNNIEYLTVSAYSEKYKISKQAVYSKIKRNILRTEMRDNISYVIDDNTKPIKQQLNNIESADNTNIENITKLNIEQQAKTTVEQLLSDEKSSNEIKLLEQKVKYLEEQLKSETEARERVEQEKKEAIERADKRLEEAHKLIAMGQQNIGDLSNNIKQLEHKAEIIKEELTKEKSKSWVQKLLKR